ncbi:MAG: UDP-N-acetylmuramoyl-L-alanine--D-glutamate ligase [Castellaniella sp.]
MSTVFEFPSVRRDGLTLILGLGETGVAAARWCARQGAALRVLDTRDAPAGLVALTDQGIEADVHLGADGLQPAALDGVVSIVLSPGLNPHQAPVAGFLQLARERSIEIIGEIELFARALADLRNQGYTPGVLAITGTNGKTTVTALVRHLAQGCGRPARAAGNISPAALHSLMDALQTDDLPALWVLELSSFQLETTHSLVADAAVVLNITQDHLDWHGSMQDYAAAKARLLEMARIRIINRDDARVSAMVEQPEALDVRSFGAGLPVLSGDLGLQSSHDLSWLAYVPQMDAPAPDNSRRKGRQPEAAMRAPGTPHALMPVDALQIRGRHNALNSLAALALGDAVGLDWAGMLHALRQYRGEAHRTEFIQTIAGVDFIDDSKGTNVGATLAALQGLGRPVVLIAGGLGKGQDFSPLASAVQAHARAVMLIGQDAAIIAQALKDSAVPLIFCDTLPDAVQQGLSQAQPGDAVLLSPACASMDMFRNYAHRSACFVEAVRELAADRGEVA